VAVLNGIHCSVRDIVTRARAAFAVGVVATGLTVVAAPPAHGAPLTFDVTSSACSGPGSIQDAAASANANPGIDTIRVAAGLTVNLYTCTRPGGVLFEDWYAISLTDSVVIEGNGATVDGLSTWIDTAGNVNPKQKCPNGTGYLTLTYSPAFAEIGDYRTANPGLTVTVRDLNLQRIPSAFLVNGSASLNLTGSNLDQINDIYGSCSRPMIDATRDGASVAMSQSTISNSWAYTANLLDVGAVIAVGTGNLDVFQSGLADNKAGRAFMTGGAANIVSTVVSGSGGARAYGGTMNIVNSAVVPSLSFRRTDRISAFGGSTVNLTASSVSALTTVCIRAEVDTPCDTPGGPLEAAGAGSSINLIDSAVGSFTRSPGGPVVMPAGGTYTSNARTWVQPTQSQDAAAIAGILPNAITDDPGLPNDATPPAFLTPGITFPRLVIPVLSDGVNPGRLIDAVPDATCAGSNALINPIDGSCITADVFGQPRWDSNDTRNIGAIQLALSPYLAARPTGGGGGVALTWNRVPDPLTGPITGYSVCYRVRGSGAPCTTVAVAGPDTLTTTISGLTNGTEYEFSVAVVNQAGNGPQSNVAPATPLGPLAPPVVTASPGDGEVGLSWPIPDLGGHPLAGYTVAYRPVGATDWVGAGTVTTNAARISGLTNGTAYEFLVTAVSTDGVNSEPGRATATPQNASATTTTSTTSGGSAGGLATTGGNTLGLGITASALLAGGIVLLLMSRRRSSTRGRPAA